MARQLLCSVALVLSACVGFHPVRASTVVVPDAFSTVQSAIDSGADTVLIRGASYPERPVVDHAVVLQGIGVGQRPRLAGLAIFNSYFWAIPPSLSVNRIDFSGRVEHTTLYYRPRNLNFAFTDCSLDSGFYQVVSLDPDDVASLTFRRCHLRGQSSARIYQEVMEADTIDGGVSWDTHDDFIHDCWFTGGLGIAIGLSSRPTGTISDNRIEGYDTGVNVTDASYLVIEQNSIVRCGTAIAVGGSDVDVRQNDIRDGGLGVYLGGDGISVRDNTIADGHNEGIRAREVSSVVAERNVIERCGGAGILFDWDPWATSIKVLNNTVLDNAGSGLELNGPPGDYPGTVTVENNIVYGNGGWGLALGGGGPVQVGCNDWFGNGLGPVTGVSGDSTSLNVDPLFCDAEGGDVTLQSTSPLVGVSGCGQIGALGVGCGVTATLVRRFTAERASDGIRIVWQVAEGATASQVWLERAEAMDGPVWIRPLTERSVENVGMVELDRRAASDRTYWYRLVALEGSHAVVIGPPIVVESEARLEFRLLEVGPNPGSGPMRIAFALKQAAAIEIDVFDVQGRRVAPLVRGVWAAGTQAVEWDGRTRNGEVVPAGLYLLRYSYPGGQDRRAIVRMR